MYNHSFPIFDESSHKYTLIHNMTLGSNNDWSSLQANNKRIMTPTEWRAYVKVRGLTPFTLSSMPVQPLYNITMTKGMCGYYTRHVSAFMNYLFLYFLLSVLFIFPLLQYWLGLGLIQLYSIKLIGSTWYQNCFHQKSKSANPAHWLMKLGVWYEVAVCQSNYSSSNIFEQNIRLPYDHVVMAQCPSFQFLHQWQWGQVAFDAIRHRSDVAAMTGPNTQYHNVNYQGIGDPVDPPDKFICYEDLYMSARMGLWFQGNNQRFKSLLSRLASPLSVFIVSPTYCFRYTQLGRI